MATSPWWYDDEVPVAARAAAPAPKPVAGGAGQRSGVESTLVPAEVRDRFVRVGRDYYFPSGSKAFRDRGTKVVTHSENVEVIRSLVQIAHARGWRDITVTGGERFRRDAWRIATLTGLVVRGYKPSEFEKQKFVREIAMAREPRKTPVPPTDSSAIRREATSENSDRRKQTEVVRARETNRSNAHEPEQSLDAARDTAAASAGRGRMYNGTLFEHGAAPYEFHPQGEPSYFVRIQTPGGPKVLWGKDLERAVRDAKAQPGDEIQLRQTGRRNVTVKRHERDSAGRVLNAHDFQTHRNQWDIRRSGGSAEEPQRSELGHTLYAAEIDSREAIRQNPEMRGALLALEGARLFAEARIKDPTQRSGFVNAVREQLVQVLDRGELVPVPRMRERTQQPVRATARTLA